MTLSRANTLNSSLEAASARAVFRADERKDTELVEYFAFGHPIIEAITERVLSPRYPGVTGTRRITAGDDLEPVRGWLFIYVSLPRCSGRCPGCSRCS